MSSIINAVREVMSTQESHSMNVGDILKRLAKGANAMKLKKDELIDCLDYYKKLQVIYVDQDENVVFLWVLPNIISSLNYIS